MTLLNAIYLEDLADQVYNPLHPNRKMRFNHSVLKSLLQTINSRNLPHLSHNLINLIAKMLDFIPKNRPSLTEIQDEIE